MKDLLDRIQPGSEAAFPRSEFDGRVAKLQAILAQRGLDLYLTSGAENIFYLTGQQTPGYYTFQCLGVPVSGTPFLILRGLEAFNARANTFLDDIEGYPDGTDPAAFLASALTARGFAGKRVAIDRDAWFLTVNLYEKLTAACGRFEDGAGLVEPLRRVKSPLELEAIATAQRWNDAGMAAGLQAVRAGATENEVAGAIMGATIAAGSEYMGMEPFVTSGPRSGVPHSTWRRRTIGTGDVVILETAAVCNRYHAALFRTMAVGSVPDLALRMYACCEEAFDAALGQMKPGNSCALVHNAAQAVIDRHGFTEGYRKRTGYSMGVSFAPDWGEGNILSLFRTVDVRLEPGMVFHVPITLREYARWTVAVSDTVVVTETGPKPLSSLARGLKQV